MAGWLLVLSVCLALLAVVDLAVSKRTRRSPQVAVLQVYPRLFKFGNGAAALYYKQMGKERVNAYFNGSEVGTG